MSDIAIRPASRRWRWSMVALIASLVVNAFFIGATATALFHFRGDFDGIGPHALRFELHWLAGKLSRAGVDHIEAAVIALRPSTEAHIEKMRELRRAVGTLVAQPDPDRAAINARLSEIRAELQAMQTEMQGAVVDALLKLPPDERAKLAEASDATKQ
jgi:uncharacterized membrane protein